MYILNNGGSQADSHYHIDMNYYRAYFQFRPMFNQPVSSGNNRSTSPTGKTPSVAQPTVSERCQKLKELTPTKENPLTGPHVFLTQQVLTELEAVPPMGLWN